MAKRNKLEIIKDILKIIKENKNQIKPTPLLRKSNISTNNFKKYHIELLEKEFIKENSNHKSEKFISVTEKGDRFIQKYQTIIDFIDEFEL